MAKNPMKTTTPKLNPRMPKSRLVTKKMILEKKSVNVIALPKMNHKFKRLHLISNNCKA